MSEKMTLAAVGLILIIFFGIVGFGIMVYNDIIKDTQLGGVILTEKVKMVWYSPLYTDVLFDKDMGWSSISPSMRLIGHHELEIGKTYIITGHFVENVSSGGSGFNMVVESIGEVIK
jgi:hypothetical protein